MFVAPELAKKQLLRLQADLQRLLAGHLAPGDSLIVVPLRDEHLPEIHVLGLNNILSYFDEKPLKIIL